MSATTEASTTESMGAIPYMGEKDIQPDLALYKSSLELPSVSLQDNQEVGYPISWRGYKTDEPPETGAGETTSE